MSEWQGTEIGSIPPEWDIKTLDQYIQDGRSICYGVVQPGFHDENGIPIIRVNNLKDGRINSDDVLKVSADIESKYSRSRLKGGELLVSLVGNVGEIVIVDSQYEGWNIARAVGVIPVDDNIDREWLKYWLQSSQVKHYINTHCNTTVQITLNLKDVSELPILEPPLEEQKLISKIPSILDRKISNLRQQNETLEQIAQTLFKHWFVDFEFPNEDGKPYKSSGGKMERSELGDIPEGWDTGILDDILNLIIDYRGKTPKKLGSDWSLSGIPALSAKNVKDGQIVREDSMNFVDEDLYRKWMKDELQKGDVLLTSEAPLGELFYLANDRKYVLSQRLFALRTKQGFCSTYLYFWLKSPQGQFLLERRATGSTVEGIRQVELRKVEIIIPDSDVLEKATQIWLATLKKNENNNRQIQTLTEIRDRLLPKLMSGQLRIPES
jgi:type I restriction enzyme, S subunit